MYYIYILCCSIILRCITFSVQYISQRIKHQHLITKYLNKNPYQPLCHTVYNLWYSVRETIFMMYGSISICMMVCVHTYTWMKSYIHTYMYIYIYTYTYIHTHTYILYTHICTYMHIYAHIQFVIIRTDYRPISTGSSYGPTQVQSLRVRVASTGEEVNCGSTWVGTRSYGKWWFNGGLMGF